MTSGSRSGACELAGVWAWALVPGAAGVAAVAGAAGVGRGRGCRRLGRARRRTGGERDHHAKANRPAVIHQPHRMLLLLSPPSLLLYPAFALSRYGAVRWTAGPQVRWSAVR